MQINVGGGAAGAVVATSLISSTTMPVHKIHSAAGAYAHIHLRDDAMNINDRRNKTI